jgi:putative ABC transport system permease protein
LDSAGTRAVVLTAPPSAKLNSNIIDQLAAMDGVSWVGGFGPAKDVQERSFAGGKRVAMRDLWSFDQRSLGVDDAHQLAAARASNAAARSLGLIDGVGVVVDKDGVPTTIGGTVRLPTFLSELEPVVLVPSESSSGTVTLIVAIASRPSQVQALTHLVVSLVPAGAFDRVQVKTSTELANLRAVVQTRLGSSGREIVAISLILSGALVTAVLTGLVFMRRRDFGRRRALGASRRWIIHLVVCQTLLQTVLGVFVGTVVATAGLGMTGSPTPPLSFLLANALLFVIGAGLGSLFPALYAATRDPAKELRVP